VNNGFDRWGNLIYKLDKDGFLLANFRALKINDLEFYVFPNKFNKFFYFEHDTQPWWRVVLHKGTGVKTHGI
jgi:hypothetical protein